MQFKFLPLLALFASAAVAGPIASPLDSSEVQSLENGILDVSAIPAGAKIEYLGESTVSADASGTITANPAVVARGQLMKRHDCNGSNQCGARVSNIACRNAINEFGPETWFCGNRRRYDNNGGVCLAIFEPHSTTCIIGWKVRELFLNIYNVTGCQKCGRWFDANATFRLDYCSSNCGEI